MPVEKKYVKLSLAALAVVAVVVGLAVGLAPKQRADGGSLSSAAATSAGNLVGDYAAECEGSAISAKSAKSTVGRERRQLRELGTENDVLASEGGASNSKSAKDASQANSNKGEAEATKAGKCLTPPKCPGDSKSSKSESEKGGDAKNKGSVGVKSAGVKSAGAKSAGDKNVGDKSVESKNAGGGKSSKAPTLCAGVTSITPSPTSGSTPTVSTETTGPPTMPRRGSDGPL